MSTCQDDSLEKPLWKLQHRNGCISREITLNTKKLNVRLWPSSLILRGIVRVPFQTYLFHSMNGSEIHLQLQSMRKIHHLSVKSQESLMDTACDKSLKIRFETVSLTDFWIFVQNEYVEPSELITSLLLIFGTSPPAWQHWQQLNQSAVTNLKLQSGLQVSVSMIHPRMSHLVSNMQTHPSHWISTVEFIFLNVK
jgi:hypothetical protein